jgi:hypothetical protein
MEQLSALGVILGNPNSTAKAFTNLKEELAREKAAQATVQIEVEMITQAVNDIKISAGKFAAQIPILEEKVKHLDSKDIDGLTELRARELRMECTTKANDDFSSQNAKLTSKLESKPPWLFHPWFTPNVS